MIRVGFPICAVTDLFKFPFIFKFSLQVFHICALADPSGRLYTYSFLCPNGTVFNQRYFICDWWLLATNCFINLTFVGSAGGSMWTVLPLRTSTVSTLRLRDRYVWDLSTWDPGHLPEVPNAENCELTQCQLTIWQMVGANARLVDRNCIL